MDRACGTHGGDERCLKRLGEKHEGNRPFGRSRYRW